MYYLCAKTNAPSFFAELTEFAAELSESLLRNSTLETVSVRLLSGTFSKVLPVHM